MILKFISANLEIDLANSEVTVIEENNWFSTQFFSKYTFPVNLDITPEINIAFGDILNPASDSIITFLHGKFYYNGLEHEAVLDVEEVEGKKMSVNIRFGLEEIPNYSKKLAELPLQYLDLGETTIYNHALSVVSKTYPEVNYNFVMVHTNKFDTESTQWAYFEGLLNKKIGINFVENEFDELENVPVNRNVMQPQPYLMHVIEKALNDAGYNFGGTFKNHPKFQHALISEISTYYTTPTADSQELYVTMPDYVNRLNLLGLNYGVYDQTITLSNKGRYKVAGNLKLRKHISNSFVAIYINNQPLIFYAMPYGEVGSWSYQVDFNIDLPEGTVDITVLSLQLSEFYDVEQAMLLTEETIADLTITQIAQYDESGELVSTLLAPTDIKLTECVPDMTFGELMEILKNWKNIDVDIDETTFYINSVEKRLIPENVKSLVEHEVKYPKRIYTKGDSFWLKFKEITSELYSYGEIFVNQNGMSTDSFNVDDDTVEVIINALPLPIAIKNDIETADHFVDDNQALKLILYNGTVASENKAQDPEDILLYKVYHEDWQTWLDIRINSKGTAWSFTVSEEAIKTLNIKDHVYAYSRPQIIKSITKDLVAPGLWAVDIELKENRDPIAPVNVS